MDYQVVAQTLLTTLKKHELAVIQLKLLEMRISSRQTTLDTEMRASHEAAIRRRVVSLVGIARIYRRYVAHKWSEVQRLAASVVHQRPNDDDHEEDDYEGDDYESDDYEDDDHEDDEDVSFTDDEDHGDHGDEYEEDGDDRDDDRDDDREDSNMGVHPVSLVTEQEYDNSNQLHVSVDDIAHVNDNINDLSIADAIGNDNHVRDNENDVNTTDDEYYSERFNDFLFLYKNRTD